MLYYPDQLTWTMFDGVTPTAAFSGNQKAFSTAGFSKLSLGITYDMDAGETANELEIQIEQSPNNTDWFALTIDTTATDSVITQRIWQLSEESLDLFLDIGYRYMRVSLREIGVASTFGTATIIPTLSGL